MKRFSPEEQEAIEAVVKGDSVANFARFIGKFAIRSPHIAALTGAGGYALGGPLGAMAAPMVGEAGHLASEAMTARSAAKVHKMVRTGPKRHAAGEAAEAARPKNRLRKASVLQGSSRLGGIAAPADEQQ
jgi:hypothetical protein